jgi:hypothetical protein
MTTNGHLNLKNAVARVLTVAALAAVSGSLAASPEASAARSLSGTARHQADASTYGYPVKPFHVQHPIRGFFGDPRIGGDDGKIRQFHFGVDISAANGTAVYATITGAISLLHPDVVVIGGAGGVYFSYWHILPTVHAGEHAVAYKTVIGHIEKPWAHVHFSESRYGRYLNPLRPGAMGPYADTTVPSVDDFEIERGQRQLALRAVSGSVDLVVETSDEVPLAVPAPWDGLPAIPALIRWRIVGVTRWATAVDFRETIPSAGAFASVFANGTTQNRTHVPGRYRIYLARGWNAGNLQTGAYKVEVRATDIRGNTAHFVSTIKVVNP